MRAQSITIDSIVFEQPLNDSLRFCLRIEHLKKQFDSSLEVPTRFGSRMAMFSLLKTLNVVDRPDIKSKLVQTLSQHATSLAQLEQFPQVDGTRLQEILGQLDAMINQLHHFHGKFADSLRQNEFLNQIRLQLNNPAGACNDRLPAYAIWLAKPIEARHQDLIRWAKECHPVQQIAAMILNITRNSTTPQTTYATNGFYQQPLDPSLPSQLIQVIIPTNLNLYPEISVGRHRLNIRFLSPCYHDSGRASQSSDAVEFALNYCR